MRNGGDPEKSILQYLLVGSALTSSLGLMFAHSLPHKARSKASPGSGILVKPLRKITHARIFFVTDLLEQAHR